MNFINDFAKCWNWVLVHHLIKCLASHLLTTKVALSEVPASVLWDPCWDTGSPKSIRSILTSWLEMVQSASVDCLSVHLQKPPATLPHPYSVLFRPFFHCLPKVLTIQKSMLGLVAYRPALDFMSTRVRGGRKQKKNWGWVLLILDSRSSYV